MTGVLVVEDQQVLAAALEIAIDTQPDMDCVGTAATVDDALAIVAERRPDVVLMDIRLPGTDGIEGTRHIKAAYPDVNIVILTASATAGRLAAAAAAGADGLLAKNGPFSDILAAIRNPMHGTMVVEGTTIRELIEHVPVPSEHESQPVRPVRAQPRPGTGENGQVSGAVRLTAREREVLALMGEGLDPSAIAERLVLSVYTARGHVKNVMMKLGAHTQLEAVVLATKSGLLPLRGAELSD